MSCRFSLICLIVLTILDSVVDLMISVEFSVERSGRDQNFVILGEVEFGAYYLDLWKSTLKGHDLIEKSVYVTFNMAIRRLELINSVESYPLMLSFALFFQQVTAQFSSPFQEPVNYTDTLR